MKGIKPLFVLTIILILSASVAFGQGPGESRNASPPALTRQEASLHANPGQSEPQASSQFKPGPTKPQESARFKPGANKSQESARFKLGWGDSIYFGGSVADLAVTRNKLDNNPLLREGNALLQNDQGGLSLGKGIALKAAVWGFVKGGEAVFPEKRRWFQGILSGIGGAFVVIAWRNSRVQ
jgi:hypothetical protein